MEYAVGARIYSWSKPSLFRWIHLHCLHNYLPVAHKDINPRIICDNKYTRSMSQHGITRPQGVIYVQSQLSHILDSLQLPWNFCGMSGIILKTYQLNFEAVGKEILRLNFTISRRCVVKCLNKTMIKDHLWTSQTPIDQYPLTNCLWNCK